MQTVVASGGARGWGQHSIRAWHVGVGGRAGAYGGSAPWRNRTNSRTAWYGSFKIFSSTDKRKPNRPGIRAGAAIEPGGGIIGAGVSREGAWRFRRRSRWRCRCGRMPVIYQVLGIFTNALAATSTGRAEWSCR